MSFKNRVELKRRNYNQLVARESIEDYALRYSPSSFRNWSEFIVANTAIGSISFLALEVIGATIAINYGFENAFWSILTASVIIFFLGLPICYQAARHNIDIDLLTRATGFGYLGSTITSLIYASFCFIFFALEAAIMAQALFLYTGMPLQIGYAVCSIIIIPLVFYGMTLINRLQLYTQPIWLILMIIPFIAIFIKEPDIISYTLNLAGTKSESAQFSLTYFGFALGISLSLIAQIGEQVDYLRFMPDKTKHNSVKWWLAVLLSGPGWIILGFLKQMGGVFLAALVIMGGASINDAKEPIHMYQVAYSYVFAHPDMALTFSFFFVIISQIKINVTNAYAGSLAWSNFFSRITHSHPGRVVWLVFNIIIALLLMEIGLFDVLGQILGLYSNIAIAWITAIVADLVINKPLGLSPPIIEFKRAHLFNINPVGVFSTLIASILSVIAFSGFFGESIQAFSAIIALVTAFLCSPVIALLTKGKYYIARQSEFTGKSDTVNNNKINKTICGVCGIAYVQQDMAKCSMYQTDICSLCCTLEARCHDQCKDKQEFSLKNIVVKLTTPVLKYFLHTEAIQRLVSVFQVFLILSTIIAFILGTSFIINSHDLPYSQTELLLNLHLNLFYIFILVAMIAAWIIVLMNESRHFVETELTQKNQALDISEERYDLAMSVANDGLFDWNMETDEVLFDSRYYTMAQYKPGDFPQSYEQWEQRIHVEDRAQVISRVQDYIDGKINKYDTEFRFLRKDGSYMWIRARGGIVSHDKTGKPLRFLGTHSDITDRKKIEEQITTHAYYDSLTSLPNRFLSLERLDLLIKKAERKQYKIAVLFLDLDDFKKVNDSLGHEVGDRVLIEAASRLKSIIRNEDTVGRLGGDEFILLLDGLKKSTDAEPVAKKLIQKFQLPFTIDKRELILTTSVGIAIYPEDGSTAARLLRHADAAMYNAKALGRNTFSFFTEELNHKVVRRLALEEQLHGALKREEFIVYFQPKIDIANGHIMGAEALLRWSNPVLGQVSPEEFIPLAEQSGLIISLGEFVLKQSLTILKQWQYIEQVKNEQFSIAINLSPRQFRDPRLADTFIQLIEQSGLSFHLIELELTEGILMSGHHYINDSLLQLSQSGLLLAMDDFGTGYSSLSYLRKYPFNIVKIDRSFINEMDSNHNDRELINAIVSMAHSLNLKVVAEGVETESQLNYLRQIGCDYAQGYYFSKPLSASKMEKFLLS